MANNLIPGDDGQSLYFARSDVSQLLGTFSAHRFSLEDREWPTVEHYFQAMKFETTSPDYFEKIRQASDAKKARKLGSTRFNKVRDDWKKVRRVVMTRAVYTRSHEHLDSKQALLDTGKSKLIENSQYDYFWGCGRDRRGENIYGHVLMDVREKLSNEE